MLQNGANKNQNQCRTKEHDFAIFVKLGRQKSQ